MSVTWKDLFLMPETVLPAVCSLPILLGFYKMPVRFPREYSSRVGTGNIIRRLPFNAVTVPTIGYLTCHSYPSLGCEEYIPSPATELRAIDVLDFGSITKLVAVLIGLLGLLVIQFD
jgi:hypothetical protein